MPVQRLRTFLDERDVKYVLVSHSIAFTAQEVAASAHIRGKEIAKTVMVLLDGRLAMAVLPASYQINFDMLRTAAGAEHAHLAHEEQFRDEFPDCELGAMPPFGNLYDLPVYVAESLAEDEEIAFNACSHTELMRLAYADFERLVKPTVAHFSVPELPLGAWQDERFAGD